MQKEKLQMSESIIIAILLAIAGGFRDAYSFNCRGHVFANAQTGNLALFSIHIARSEYMQAYKFIFPILAFVFGIILAELIKFLFKNKMDSIHWRQIVVFIEIIMLIIVGFIPNSSNHLANVIISLTCSMQVESFRKFMNFPMATTMCTGNLRSGAEAFSNFTFLHEKEKLFKALYYVIVIFMFCVGVGFGAILGNIFGNKSIWADSLIMTLIFFLMFKEESFLKKI